ncbi:MAG: hypothetical protein Q8N54_15565 [Sulfurimicrobium sp.]|nr:hypothetical protein [Sulfurimicrobium sp.]MDP2200253.1 hypothetical protein [Sulfurimicrobium sp.]MDP2964169.1 hypothetical protein [Sulfurimicrobium sp.]MDP3686795.1 hypothetical protein [Sulfurimicrobium sp.]
MSGSQSNAGRLTFHGSVGVEAEDYQYDTKYGTRDRTRLRTRFDLNGRGFIWDPRFATFDAGVTLQRDNVQTVENDDVSRNSSNNLLGYRLNTTWFANKPFPLSIYANRSQSTVSDFWSPSYELVSDNVGARWGMNNRWLGRSNFYIDRRSSESSNSLVPRSEQNLSLGMDASQKLRAKQWGESDLSYGYRHTAWEEQVYGGSQRQDYFYLNDRSLFGDKANLTANLTYYDRSDQWGFAGSGGNVVESKFLGFNSMFNVQQTENFRHFYGLGLGMNSSGTSQNTSYNLSGGANYRLNARWQVNGMLGLSGSSSEMRAASLDGLGQKNDTTALTGSAGIMYSDTFFSNYLVNGGYTLALMQTNSTMFAGLPAQQNTTHTANIGYARMNSPLYADSLQLRMSQTVGEPGGSESNVRYSVNSTLTQSDMLQGTAEYRRYQRKSVVWTNDADSTGLFDYYNVDSQSTRLDLGWMHRFSEAGSTMLSAGATNSVNQDVAFGTRYVQARATMRLRSALNWTALARAEQIDGSELVAGRKLTVESDVNYRIGKWQASVRFRLRDVQQELAPFKEKSVFLMLRRDYALRL